MQAIFINSLGRGGAERVVSYLLSHSGKESDNLLITLTDDIAYPVPANVKHIVLDHFFEGIVPPILRMFFYPLLLAHITRKYKLRRVQSHLFRANCINVASKLFGSSHFASIVNTGAVSTKYNDGSLKCSIAKICIKHIYARANRVIYKSKAMQADYNQTIKKFRHESVFYNPIDTKLVLANASEVVDDFQFKKDTFYIAVVGRLIKSKRVSDLIQALNVLKSSHSATYETIHLVVIGKGDQKEALARDVNEAGLNSKVTFLGYQPNPFKYVSKCQLYVSASESEGLPNSLIEAMLCKVPVLSADCYTGPREILSKAHFLPRSDFSKGELDFEDFGCLTAVGDIKALAKGILHYYEHRNSIDNEPPFQRALEFDIEKKKKSFYRDLAVKIGIFTNTSWNIYKFRKPLVDALHETGYDLNLICPDNTYISDEPLPWESFELSRSGSNPIAELRSILHLGRIVKNNGIEIMLPFSVKPNLYSCIVASTRQKLKVVCNISGLGTVFLRDGFKSRVAKFLYRIFLSNSRYIFFQNKEDRDLFEKVGLVSDQSKTKVLPGSGIDLKLRDTVKPELTVTKPSKKVQFLFVGRLLKDKGVFELIDAVKILNSMEPERFELNILGAIDEGNLSSLTKNDLIKTKSTQGINYLGFVENALEVIAQTECIILPSYREGTPRVLLEAGLLSKPMIATDVPGCRDVVIDNETGFLCKSKDQNDLAGKMQKFINLSIDEKQAMGEKSFKHISNKYDVKHIVNSYRRVIEELSQ